jgi:hypothetical protein
MYGALRFASANNCVRAQESIFLLAAVIFGESRFEPPADALFAPAVEREPACVRHRGVQLG